MKPYCFIIPLLLLVLGAPAALRADTTYYLTGLDIAGQTITGTISTDGNTGALSFTDVNSFSWGIQNASSATGGPGGTVSEQGKSPDVSGTGSGFTATASGLFFDFDNSQQSTLIFRNALDGFELCLFTDEGCDPPGSGELLSLSGSSNAVTGLSGNVMIASVTSTPEPRTSGLVLIGMGGLLLLMRKRFLPADPSAC
ncbi:MAG: PEP-CTERM sorting domain-containing protein [Candidatus Acidiferrum sp.]|jgi:hypothetical protein